MAISGVKCIGGQITYRLCTAKLLKENEKRYEYYKILAWLDLINNNHSRPKKWLKPSKAGTRVNFESIETKEDYHVEIGKLKGYVEGLNEKFGTDWKLSY